MESIRIEIDKITSGKNNIITFERKGRQVNLPPLLLKSSSSISEYRYRHHFDKEDLDRLNTQFSGVYSNPTEQH